MSVATIKLSETTKFIVDNRGKTVPTTETGIPLIATNCIDNRNLYPVYEKLRYVSQETYDNWFRSHPKPMDIILTLKGSQNGAVNLVPDPIDFCIAQDMVALRVDETKIDNLYLFAALRSDDIQDQIKTLDVSGVIPHFKKSDFDKLEIPLPPRPLQEFIGKTYFDLCKKIDLLHCQNKTLEAMAETLFRQWFIEEAKEDWREKPLDEVVSHFIDYRGKTPNKTTSGIPLITAKIVKAGRIQEPTEFISEEDYPIWMTRGYPEINDVVLTTEAPLGEVGLIRDTNVALAQRIITMRCNPGIFDNVLLKYYLMSEVGQYELDSRASGTTVFGIKASVLKKLSLLIPPLEQQKVIAEQLHAIEDKMYANEKQARSLAKLRDTLLPKLMSGEVRAQYQTEEVS